MKAARLFAQKAPKSCLFAAMLTAACGGESPVAPTGSLAPSATSPLSGGDTAPGAVRGNNAPPRLVVRTTPEADYSTSPPTITVRGAGNGPFKVLFGLCQSDDPDAGDSLNWQFNFGDSGRPAFNPDGTFNADFDHQCRVEHDYKPGDYTAWVSVTDKHLEDQSREARAMARTSRSFLVRVVGEEPTPGPAPTAGTCGISVNTNFDGIAVGTPVAALTVPGVSITGSGTIDTAPLNVLPFDQQYIRGDNTGMTDFTFTSDQDAYSFSYAINFVPLVVQGFDSNNNLVFTQSFGQTFPPTPPLPTASGSGRFRRLRVTGANSAIDNLTSVVAPCI